MSQSLLEREFAKRSRESAKYSLRSFAKDLCLSPSTLSRVLNGKRQIPRTKVNAVLNNLKLSPKEESVFLESFSLRPPTSSNLNSQEAANHSSTLELSEMHYQILAEWEHFAILSLLKIQKYQSSISEIGKKLGISIPQVSAALTRLKAASLVTFLKNKWSRTPLKLKSSEDVLSRALQKAHREELSIAQTKLQEIEVSMRDFSSITMAIDTSRLDDAKKLIRKFRQEMSALLESDDATEVYQLGIQLYPLTKINHIAETKK